MNNGSKIISITQVIIVLMIALFLVACKSFPEDEEVFKELVMTWIPIGTSVQDARNIIENNGFEVERLKPEKWWNDQHDILHSTYDGYAFFPCRRQWRVNMVIENEKIMHVYTMIVLTCP